MKVELPSAPADPVRILSDLHLAHPASLIGEVESLRPLLEGAGTVVFNGDTCEQRALRWLERGADLLGELRELCREVGAEPIFLPGNHDPEIAEEGWIELAGGQVLVSHGHAIFPEVAPWSHEYLNEKQEVWRIIHERADTDQSLAERWATTRLITDVMRPKRACELGKGGRNYVLSAVWPPERCLNIARVWLTMVGRAERFMERYRPEARVFLFGHFHRPGGWKRKERHLWNTGAFMRGSRPWMAELKDGRLALARIARGADGYFRLGEGRRVLQVHEARPALVE